ncbi:sigma-54 dependent transcriptional regulator [Candidatus Persebacteraceae bacterium Df01]|uniref:Sigma-54 dependent transcriptional regulator n=1 Tax=Candidatus Doriopsillibacter californiensis TaxID=2970740 RepID=A0ABT7QL77_9GAMM|nr:sigma-54 dependent transcriptional regulator [Candidatus Persebacteraceae bacterium Df01]
MSAKPLLLIVDDDSLIQDALSGYLNEDFSIIGAHNVAEVKSALQQSPQPPDCALVDLGLPPVPHRPDEGFAAIRLIQAASPDCAIVVVSGQEARRHAQRARALGAGDYVEKPCEPNVLRDKLLSCKKMLTLARRNMGLVGDSPAIVNLRQSIAQASAAPFPVLIRGETGTGKELVARALHENSRAGKAFLPINCATIPDHLAEPTLFGHAKGAFTGAAIASAGLLGDAEDGTLFLDEIADLSPSTQGKLLRAVETGEYSRVGETRPRQCAARIVAATNRIGGDFRRDLYHRLSAFVLSTPPLRELAEDRFVLLAHFRTRIAKDMHALPFELTPGAEAIWRAYRFPGNTRELRNIVARLQIKCGGGMVDEDTVTAEFYPGEDFDDGARAAELHRFANSLLQSKNLSLPVLLDEIGAVFVRETLVRCNDDETQAAAILKISTTQLRRQLRQDFGGTL